MRKGEEEKALKQRWGCSLQLSVYRNVNMVLGDGGREWPHHAGDINICFTTVVHLRLSLLSIYYFFPFLLI